MRNVKLSFMSAMLLALSGCAVDVTHQDAQKAVADVPEFSEQSDSFDTQAMPEQQWWRLYEDETLNSLVTEALRANKELKVAQLNLNKARSILSEVDSRRLPSTSIDGGVSYGDGIPATGMSIGEEQWTQYGTFAVAWETDLFGRVSHAINAASADVAAVQAARDGVRITVAAETSRAYFNACAYGYSVSIAEQALEISQKQLRLVTKMEEAGRGVLADIERAKAVVADVRAQVPALEAQRRAALLELTALLGRMPDNIPAAAAECQRPPEPGNVLPVGNAKQLLRRRPDLRRAELILQADAERLDVAVAELYPQISIGASVNYFNTESVSTDDAWSFSLGPLISWRFPNQSAARARIRQAEAQEAVSFAQFEDAVIRALSDVEKALDGVANERQRVSATQDAMNSYELAYKHTNLRYIAGANSHLEVLIAQRDMLSAQTRYAEALQRLASQRITLFKALGGGWQNNET